MAGPKAAKVDTTVAHIARVYDYWLGGKDNFAVDRIAAERVIAAYPNIVRSARGNRRFLGRAVRYLVEEAGVRQFLDIGTGLPAANNTHEVAQGAAPECRVVYVDNDPVVLSHAEALLASGPEGVTAYVDADLRDPETILAAAAEVLDFSRPVAIMLVAILQHISDQDDPCGIVARLVAEVPSGSYLTLSHPARDIQAKAMAEIADRMNELVAEKVSFRTRAEVLSFFDGLELVEPGLVPVPKWRPASDIEAASPTVMWGGVGRKSLVLSHTGPVDHGRRRNPRPAGPSDRALHWLAGWYAIALRLGGAVLFTAVAVLAATKQTSGWWLAAPLTALCVWSAFFAWRVRRSGLTTALVLIDVAVIAALALAQQHLVPAVLIKANTTWMLPLACTSVYILQVALRLWLSLPAAAILVAAYGLGAGDVTDGWLLAVETVVAAGLVAVIRGGARQADAVVAAGLATERQIRAEEARRADEREQHRQLHDTILSTLTMVAAGAFAGPSPALTAQAARDLRVLEELAEAPAEPAGLAPLADLTPQLELAAAGSDDLTVRLKLVPVTVPSPVADQLVACVGEALRNVERHAGTGQAEVIVSGGAGWAIVKITDRGRGFDPAATPPSRRGIRESITGRMVAAGGRATIASRPGAGTTVTVSWPA